MALQESVTGFDSLHFQLIDRTPRSDLRILCSAGSDEEKATWIQLINEQLDLQKNFLNGKLRLLRLSSPLHSPICPPHPLRLLCSVKF